MAAKPILTLDDAKRVAAAAEAEAVKNEWKTVIAVVDDVEILTPFRCTVAAKIALMTMSR